VLLATSHLPDHDVEATGARDLDKVKTLLLSTLELRVNAELSALVVSPDENFGVLEVVWLIARGIAAVAQIASTLALNGPFK